ncbi:protein regulator of cytokinesis 1-like isoform X2 [Zootermopsis nevadensis]|uniref:protein regulator of cytokinesis 1-like isoform X2 n=1 Tax=Zootermopsis nevadensis TaxID=136037 RepID=UPI000B8E8C5B|nr:protein regulator of cytokinesis 1-like isoform X2 [Zootermopsis nevadensis]
MDSFIPSSYCNDVSTAVNNTVTTYMDKLASIWGECGYDDISIGQRCEAVKQHVQKLFEEMLEEEQENKDLFVTKIEQHLEEISELRKDLNMEISVPEFENLPLCNIERTLRHQLGECRKIKESLACRLADLQRKEKMLCDDLGIEPQTGFTDQFPTEQRLDDFENYIKERDIEKQRLMHLYQESKSAIIAIMTELAIAPTQEFERLVCGKDAAFRPTRENMAALNQLHQRLEQQLEDGKAQVAELREKLTQLWDRLREDYGHRENFLSTYRGHSSATLEALKDEVKRCEVLKRQNIKRFVEEIREELKHLWDKCLISEDERVQFRPYYSECFTADLLELHELEVQKLKSHYDQNDEIFQLAYQRQELWDKMLELENRANDPDRLFHNRGGQLLIEEKERKLIQKDLPKVEKELMKYVSLYEKRHKKPFKIHGQPVSDVINSQWTLHKEHKEEEKKAKKFARDRLLDVESKMGSQLRAPKRKNTPGTPLLGSHKLRKVAGIERAATLGNITRPIQQTVVPRINFPGVGTNNDTEASNMTTYTDFQNNLLPTSDGATACTSDALACAAEPNDDNTEQFHPFSHLDNLDLVRSTNIRFFARKIIIMRHVITLLSRSLVYCEY